LISRQALNFCSVLELSNRLSFSPVHSKVPHGTYGEYPCYFIALFILDWLICSAGFARNKSCGVVGPAVVWGLLVDDASILLRVD
jgi:hypothetical protein